MSPRARKAVPVRRLILPAQRAALLEQERTSILETLRSTGGDRKEAADLLGVSLRTLENRIGEHGIREDVNRISEEAGFPDRAAKARSKAYGGSRWKC